MKIAFIALTLALVPLALAQQDAARTTTSVDACTAEHFVRVTSPWGHADWYWVEPGYNELRCLGTGLLFEFWY